MDFNIIIENFILNYGVISIFVLVFLEYANFPIPSEVVLPMIGLIGTQYNINIFILVLLSTLAGILGSLLNYWIGYYFGEKVIRFTIKKFPKTKKSIHTSKTFLQKYSKLSVLVTRFVPIARTAISIVAGVARMKLSDFILFSSIGIFAWNYLLITGGSFLNKLFKMEIFSFELILVLLIIAIVILLAKKLIFDFKNNK